MKIAEIGEFGLLDRLEALLSGSCAGNRKPGTSQNCFAPETKIAGMGDDCSIIPEADGTLRLVTVDMLVEGIHFIPDTDPFLLGLRAMAVNLSDIAAMGGRPAEAYICLAIGRETPVEWIETLYRGFAESAGRWGFSVMGGDTSSTGGPAVISITMVGFAKAGRVKTRDAALPGDIICVTGTLGDSAAGLEILQCLSTDMAATLVRRHLEPKPHIAEGQWLASRPEVGAMMDVSDGIASDLLRILDRSGRRLQIGKNLMLGAIVDLDALPVSHDLAAYCQAKGIDPAALAVGGGEDYCLLATVRPEAWESVSAGFAAQFGRPLYRVGTIIESHCEGCGAIGEKIEYRRAGARVEPLAAGWDHFNQV